MRSYSSKAFTASAPCTRREGSNRSSRASPQTAVPSSSVRAEICSRDVSREFSISGHRRRSSWTGSSSRASSGRRSRLGGRAPAAHPTGPIRRVDVWKAFHGLFSQVLLSVAVFPVLPNATKYAMGSLKRSVHNCFFCYRGRRAALEDEVDFFQRRIGRSHTFAQVLDMRREYTRSFGFVVCCLPTLVRLHPRTALDNRFPREVLTRR
jgi:hypothetical protein